MAGERGYEGWYGPSKTCALGICAREIPKAGWYAIPTREYVSSRLHARQSLESCGAPVHRDRVC